MGICSHKEIDVIGQFTAIKLNDQLVAAGLPIHGVSIGNPDDKSTWRVDYKDEATNEHALIATQIITDFDENNIPDPKSEVELLREEVAQLRSTQESMQSSMELATKSMKKGKK
jgi:hypothetical protein